MDGNKAIDFSEFNVVLLGIVFNSSDLYCKIGQCNNNNRHIYETIYCIQLSEVSIIFSKC